MTVKTIRIKNYKNELTPQAEREVKVTIITLALFAAGMIIGAGIAKNSGSSETIADFSNIFDIFVQNRNNNKAYEIFLNSFAVNVLFLSASFASGLSCIGIPLICAIPIIKGIGFGMLSGYLLSVYKMSGIGYYLLTIFPGAIISVSALTISCAFAGLMSTDILSVVSAKKQPEKKIITHYLKSFMLFFISCVISSAIDTILTKAFSYLFTF